MSSPTEENKPTPPMRLKLKTSSSFLGNAANANSITAVPPVATPSAMSPPLLTPSANRKIVLKRSQPPTPAGGVPILPAIAERTPLPTVVTTTKKGRVSKPSAKKRAKNEPDSDGEAPTMATPSGTKRVKLQVKRPVKPSRTASIVVRQPHQTMVPAHPHGEGYDSEDDEREMDPVIEEEIIIRFMEDENLDYMLRMIEERKVGAPLRDGGADFKLKWLPGVERRAMVIVKSTNYAAVLVDLPTITEGMKTWDRKNFMKCADICQMLLLFARVVEEEEAKTIALPKMLGKDFRWPHGLTPPMHDCIHQRFRKRLSRKEVQDKAAELQRLKVADEKAMEVKWELCNYSDDEDAGNGQRANIGQGMMSNIHDDDAMGEVDDEEDYFGHQDYSAVDADAEIDDAALEAEFFEDEMFDDAVAETPASQPAETPATTGAPTPAGQGDAGQVASESDDDDDDDDEDLDEDEQAEKDHVKGVHEDIADLQRQLNSMQIQKGQTGNPLLQRRMNENIKKIKEELRLKKASIGMEEED